MNKKFVSLLLTVMMLIISTSKYSFASDTGKVIFISMNRMNFDEFSKIESIKKELEKRGYTALMNVRGDGGTDDKRSFATMGAGRRANVSNQENINFKESSEEEKQIYKSITNESPKKINNIDINLSIKKK